MKKIEILEEVKNKLNDVLENKKQISSYTKDHCDGFESAINAINLLIKYEKLRGRKSKMI